MINIPLYPQGSVQMVKKTNKKAPPPKTQNSLFFGVCPFTYVQEDKRDI